MSPWRRRDAQAARPEPQPDIGKMVWGWRFGTHAERIEITDRMRPSLRQFAVDLGASDENTVDTLMEIYVEAARAELRARQTQRGDTT